MDTPLSQSLMTDAPIVITPKFLGEPPRSDKWPTIRRHHLVKEPFCKMCGGIIQLEVHHMMPFHLDEAKELDDTNLITLCQAPGIECHFKHGHEGNWKNYNPKIKDMATSPSQGIPAPNYINTIDGNITPLAN